MTEEFETFRDHFLSLYQSIVTDVAKRVDATPSVPSKDGRTARALERSASATLPEFAAQIAQREFTKQRGLPSSAPSNALSERALATGDSARVCAELAFRYLKARLRGDAETLLAVESEFRASICDPAWATTIDEYLSFFGPSGIRREIPYVRAASVGDRVVTIPANARLALAGDWGTGAQPAIQILKLIRDMKPDLFVHLGDIYYSGTPSECVSGFKSIIDAVLRAGDHSVPVFTLSGNHDMYCGGVGYYDLIQKLNQPPNVQPASFFCLRSADEKWQTLALDTGLHDYSPLSVEDAVTYLEDDELEWHCARLREFPGRTILLSHHQLFSAFSPIGKPKDGQRSASNPHLLKAFNELARAGKIVAWFWGHEHALTIYKPFAGLERGRCIGHGAVPVSIRDDIYLPLPDLVEQPTIEPGTKLGSRGAVYAHGYALLELDGETCKARYYQDLGGRPDLIYSELIR
jgi:hypothetical protein